MSFHLSCQPSYLILASFLRPAKALSPTEFNVKCSVKLLRSVEPLKAPEPMSVMFDGMSNDFKPEFSKTLSPSLFASSEMVTPVISLLASAEPAKAPSVKISGTP